MQRFVCLRLNMMLSLIIGVVLISVSICAIIGIQMHRSTIRRYGRFIEQQIFIIDKTLSMFIQNGKNMADSLSKQRLLRLAKAENFPNYIRGGLEDLDGEDKLHYQDVKNMFGTIRDTYPEIEDVFMGTRWGGFAVLHEAEDMRGFDPRERPWYKDAMKVPDKVILTKAYKSNTGNMVISFAKAVLSPNSSEIIGVVGIDVSLAKLDMFMASIKIGKSGYCLLLEEDGTILVDPKHKEVVAKNLKN